MPSIVIAQGGGPTAVINQTLCGVILAARRHESSCQHGAVHTWHETDQLGRSGNVRSLGRTGIRVPGLLGPLLTQLRHRA
jgi:hypothetical protein